MFAFPRSIPKKLGLGTLALFYVGAGVNHFVHPEFYLPIMPPYLPAPLSLVYASGVFEILGGLGVLPRATRRWVGYGITAMLLVFFTVHIHMLQHPESFAHLAPKWGLVLRIPLQFVLIAWALWATKPEE